MIDWIANAVLLAAEDASSPFSFLTTLFSNVALWGRVALGIGLVIFVHELGHFVAAKTFGVKCEKFYVGFDVPIRIGPIKFPRTLGKFQYGETEYGIGIIPLGGYVKMLGQDDDPRKMEEEAQRARQDTDDSIEANPEPEFDPRSYPAKPVWQRMVIISAGVIMNVITGVLFAAIAFGYGVSYSPAIVGGVTPGGPAWQAGIEPGGKVVKVGSLSDDQMHFRDMRMEILTNGLDTPDQPIDLTIQYEDGARNFQLLTQPRADVPDARMIGLAVPNSTKLSDDDFADDGSVAAEVLTSADAGALITAFDGTPINAQAIDPGAPFFDYLYSHPSQTISLDLERVDGSKRTVDLPPQPAKSMGVRFAIGPVTALVDNGPAAEAGMKVGDVILEIGDDRNPDAYGLALRTVGTVDPIRVKVSRGVDGATDEVELQLTPTVSPQTISPTSSIGGEIAINVLGFAYMPLPRIVSGAALSGSSQAPDSDGKTLQRGDVIKEVRLVTTADNKPAWLSNPRYQLLFEQLQEGWEITPQTPLSALRDTIQAIPVGTELQVIVSRPPDDRVVTTTAVVESDDGFLFGRGLGLVASESVHKASSISDAFVLGFREGKRRFMDVVRFLQMLPRGRVKLRHVGGPLEIVNVAKAEAERGISPQLMFLTFLSMNLAILNFLPIPALDGGHMMFLLYELVAGKRANEQLEFRLTVAGLLALLMLMVVVFANDIIRHL